MLPIPLACFKHRHFADGGALAQGNAKRLHFMRAERRGPVAFECGKFKGGHSAPPVPFHRAKYQGLSVFAALDRLDPYSFAAAAGKPVT